MVETSSSVLRALVGTMAGGLVATCLAGCVVFSGDHQYGYVPLDGADVYGTGTAVVLPANAPSISQRYQPSPEGANTGERPSKGHQGFDIVAPRGAPVIAPLDGVVADSYWEPMYGNRLLILHGADAGGRKLATRYFHLHRRIVRKGEVVRRGQQVAELGASGVLAPNLHLHFETLRVEPRGPFDTLVPINPHLYWYDGPGNVTCFDRDRDYSRAGFALTYPVPCRDVAWQPRAGSATDDHGAR